MVENIKKTIEEHRELVMNKLMRAFEELNDAVIYVSILWDIGAVSTEKYEEVKEVRDRVNALMTEIQREITVYLRKMA